jgi:6-phosphogluconolactonase
VHHELEVLDDTDEVARAAAQFVAGRAEAAIADRGVFMFAVSGGHTPWAMFRELHKEAVQWDRVAIYQVDERIAPLGDQDRNLTHLKEALGDVAATIVPMPVDDPYLEDAADHYGQLIPGRFDLVHLGLGPDGHTASLVPGDPILDETRRLVWVTGPYQGNRRMTLTYLGLARADEFLWLVTGADKKDPLDKLLSGDRSIPATRVEGARQSFIIADESARGLTAP